MLRSLEEEGDRLRLHLSGLNKTLDAHDSDDLPSLLVGLLEIPQNLEQIMSTSFQLSEPVVESCLVPDAPGPMAIDGEEDELSQLPPNAGITLAEWDVESLADDRHPELPLEDEDEGSSQLFRTFLNTDAYLGRVEL
ncbi:uncharacterized protein Z519_04132 [Cladophialophora bantiana CBS 173.52]|uniref:Uncharacterized protein n=1 Tax=Cladophialophora bantiana (strain ATCC 10958 / CBS 173.52 / CDC B-1940 / NIH 8579) TaxID=1442370 RepID=A0A0D2GAF1_CLAB1|nr:uncharacterized protein Z519_04132 [Cladophialophora bantiana CBS 173.52]KIW95547.1 hypothetical protein Z519_04132 [Cladophialophora bantiana CBS 173.52]